MKKLREIILMIICFTYAYSAKAQLIKDTSFSSTLRGEVYTFKYKQVNSTSTKESLKLLSQLNIPFYISTQKDINYLRTNIQSSHQIILKLDSAIQLLKAENILDNQLKNELQNTIEQTNNRVDLYKKSYEESIKINENYSKLLAESIAINKKKTKTHKLETFIWGGLTGMALGVATVLLLK